MQQEYATWTSSAVLALVASITGFAKWLLPFLRKWERERLRAQTEQGIRDTQRMYSHLMALEAAGVPRTIIFAGHNSGGIPKPGSPFYTSAMHWNIDHTIGDPWTPEKYQDLPVDASYSKMLVDLIDNGEVRFTTADMPSSQLKAIYEAEGVTDCFITFLGIDNKQIHYMSSALYGGELTEDQITEIRLRSNAIRQLI